MSKGNKEEEGLAPGPVSFRLGDLARSVQRRARPGESLATVVRRDLARYYDLLWNTELPDFSVEEADALTILLYGYSGPEFILPTVVSERLKGIQSRLDKVGADDILRPRVPDTRNFVLKVEAMTRVQRIAALDAVERYWVEWQRDWPKLLAEGAPLFSEPLNETELILLQRVGLTHPIYASRYSKEHGLSPTADPGKRKVLGDSQKRRS